MLTSTQFKTLFNLHGATHRGPIVHANTDHFSAGRRNGQKEEEKCLEQHLDDRSDFRVLLLLNL